MYFVREIEGWLSDPDRDSALDRALLGLVAAVHLAVESPSARIIAFTCAEPPLVEPPMTTSSWFAARLSE